MAKKLLSKSQRVRIMLTQGRSVKDICRLVKCEPGLVYQVRAAEKRKKQGTQRWEAKAYSTSDNPITRNTNPVAKSQRRDELIEQAIASIQPKPSLFQRVKNFFLGC